MVEFKKRLAPDGIGGGSAEQNVAQQVKTSANALLKLMETAQNNPAAPWKLLAIRTNFQGTDLVFQSDVRRDLGAVVLHMSNINPAVTPEAFVFYTNGVDRTKIPLESYLNLSQGGTVNDPRRRDLSASDAKAHFARDLTIVVEQVGQEGVDLSSVRVIGEGEPSERLGNRLINLIAHEKDMQAILEQRDNPASPLERERLTKASSKAVLRLNDELPEGYEHIPVGVNPLFFGTSPNGRSVLLVYPVNEGRNLRLYRVTVDPQSQLPEAEAVIEFEQSSHLDRNGNGHIRSVDGTINISVGGGSIDGPKEWKLNEVKYTRDNT